MVGAVTWPKGLLRISLLVLPLVWAGLAGCARHRALDGQEASPAKASSFSEAEGLTRNEAEYRKLSQGDFPLVSTVRRDDSLFLKPSYYSPQRPLRVGLLIPLSSHEPGIRSVAESFYNAAELALMAQRDANILIIVGDTGGSPDNARAAARDVIEKGADVIVGPLLGPSVARVASVARPYAVPVIAFSNTRSVAGTGVYLLSFLPETDAYAIGRHALSQGLKRFAILAPNNDYGRRSASYFSRFVGQNDGVITGIFGYPTEQAGGKLGAFGTNQLVSAVSQLAESAKKEPYDAVFIPDGGAALTAVAPMLPYFRIDTSTVRVLGTSLFDDPTLTSVRGLEGAWFPAVPPASYQPFFADYQASYGVEPPKMAALAYDAMNLVISLARYHSSDGGVPLYLITRRKGFMGATGMFRFMPSGLSDRSMAVEQITRSGIKVLQPAPAEFSTMTDAPPFGESPGSLGYGLEPGRSGVPGS